VVVLLLPPPPDTVIEIVFSVENTRHEYRVMCLWEKNPQAFLNNPALLPLAPLTATTRPFVRFSGDRRFRNLVQYIRVTLRLLFLQRLIH
jgi:hypothetical protein